MWDEGLISVLAASHSLHITDVAMVLENGYVGNDLVDGLFGKEVCLPGLNLHDGTFLFGGEDRGVLGEDVQLALDVLKLLLIMLFLLELTNN